MFEHQWFEHVGCRALEGVGIHFVEAAERVQVQGAAGFGLGTGIVESLEVVRVFQDAIEAQAVIGPGVGGQQKQQT